MRSPPFGAMAQGALPSPPFMDCATICPTPRPSAKCPPGGRKKQPHSHTLP